MIFNKDDNGTSELRSLTGNYYNNNSFEKMTGDIMLATADLKKIIGAAVYNLAETAYHSTDTTPANIGLVPYVQLPIAILATFNMYRSNDISHEDSGRKVKISSETEKIPWQWQLKADDEIQLDKYYSAVDALIDYLDENTVDAWTTSDYKKALKSLLINSTSKFNEYYPIQNSGRIFILLLPFLKEVERIWIKKQFGVDYERYVTGSELSAKDKEVIEYLLPAIPLLTMSIAVKRLPLGIIPAGVIRNYSSSSDSRDTSNAASKSDIDEMSDWLEDQAEELIELAKRTRNGLPAVVVMPVNDPKNKFMRV